MCLPLDSLLPPLPSMLCRLICPQIQHQDHQSNLSCCLICYLRASGGLLTPASPINLFADCSSCELFSISKQLFPTTFTSAWLSAQILCPVESRVGFLQCVALQGEILALDIGIRQSSGASSTMAHSSCPVTPWWAQPHPSQMHTSGLRPAQSCAEPALPSRRLPAAFLCFYFIWCTHKLIPGCASCFGCGLYQPHLPLLNPPYICRFSVGFHACQSDF